MSITRVLIALVTLAGCAHEDPLHRYRDVGKDPMQNTDGDALVDRVDNCPMRRGGTQHSGCPDPSRVSLRAGEVALLSPVYFLEVGETLQLESASQAMIVEAAEVLNRQPWIRAVRVVSHTDSAQKDPRALSQQRADAVMAAMQSQGLRASISALGAGDSEPVESGESAAARAANNRILILF